MKKNNPSIRSLSACWLLMLALAGQAFGQESRWAAGITLSQQRMPDLFGGGSLGVYHKRPFSPEMALTVERNYRFTEKSRLFQTVRATYFHHTYVERAISLGTEIGWERRLFKGLYAGGRFGLSWWNSHRADLGYKYDGEVWQPVIITEHRYNSAAAHLTAVVGYRLGVRSSLPIDVYAGYKGTIITPWLEGYVPFALYRAPQLGMTVHF